MPFSPSLTNVAAAIFMVAVTVVSAEAKKIIAPDEINGSKEKITKTAASSEELLKIIEKQDALINALRKRINELEQLKAPSPSATPSK